MKECPYCLEKYPEDMKICPRDHYDLRLVEAPSPFGAKPEARPLRREPVDLTLDLTATFQASAPSLGVSLGLICLGGLLPWLAMLLALGGRPNRVVAFLLGLLVLRGLLVGVGIIGVVKATLQPRCLPVGWILGTSLVLSPITFFVYHW